MTEPKQQEEQPLTLEGLKGLLESERQANVEATAELVDARLDELKQPDRTTVAELGIGNTPHPQGRESTIIRPTVEDFQNRASGVSVSRHQPTDVYYRTLPEKVREWRCAETDHWGAEWIRACVINDVAAKRHAYDKSEEWIARAYGRADSLVGDPTGEGGVLDGTAGDVIPRPVEQVVLISRNNVATMRQHASSFQMTSAVHTIPTAASMTAYMTGEAAAPTQGEPTMATVVVEAKQGAVKAVSSLQALQDSAQALVQAWTVLAGEALGSLEDDQFWSTGDGTGNNISAAVAGTAYAETTSTALGFVDVAAMRRNVLKNYRRDSAWYAAADVIQFLTTVIATNGNPLYTGLNGGPGAAALGSDEPDTVGTLLGKPIYEVPLPDGEIIYGNMKRAYVVANRAGITATSSRDQLFDTQRVIWLWTQRFDGQNVDATAALQHASGIISATANV